MKTFLTQKTRKIQPFDITTRMHSSRMRTVRCSGRLGGGRCLPKGGLPERCVCPGGCTPPTVNRMTDRQV